MVNNLTINGWVKYRWHKGIPTSTGEKRVWESFLCHLVRKNFQQGSFIHEGLSLRGMRRPQLEEACLPAELKWYDGG